MKFFEQKSILSWKEDRGSWRLQRNYLSVSNLFLLLLCNKSSAQTISCAPLQNDDIEKHRLRVRSLIRFQTDRSGRRGGSGTVISTITKLMRHPIFPWSFNRFSATKHCSRFLSKTRWHFLTEVLPFETFEETKKKYIWKIVTSYRMIPRKQERMVFAKQSPLDPLDTSTKTKTGRRLSADTLYVQASFFSFSFFYCETCIVFIFDRDNSLDYLIQSGYIYKTHEALVYHFHFSFSSNVMAFYLFFFFFCIHHTHTLKTHYFSRSFVILRLFTYLHLLTLSVPLSASSYSRDETGNTSETLCETRFWFHESIVNTCLRSLLLSLITIKSLLRNYRCFYIFFCYAMRYGGVIVISRITMASFFDLKLSLIFLSSMHSLKP